MALTVTKIKDTVIGDIRLLYGTWSDGAGEAGGEIATGLHHIEAAWLQHGGSSVEANVAVINETFPLSSGSMTIVCNASDSGWWFALGY